MASRKSYRRIRAEFCGMALLVAVPVAHAATESTASDPVPFSNFFGFEAGLNNTGEAATFFGHQAGGSGNSGAVNAFFGSFAGFSNTSGLANAFFGHTAGTNNTTGVENSFFGAQAGLSNTEGEVNSFFGSQAGAGVTVGNANSFFGYASGFSTTTGEANVFIGASAGVGNEDGSENTFVGQAAGEQHFTGNGNVFLGRAAGTGYTSGDYNTLIGSRTTALPGLENSTAIGFLAQVDQSNSVVLGAISGVNSATWDTNVGIGTTAPAKRLHVVGVDSNAGQNNDVMFRIENVSNIPATRRMAELVNFGSPQLVFRDLERNESWQLNPVGNQFTISALGGGVQLFQMRTDGRTIFRSTALGPTTPTMQISASGNVTIAGTLTQGSDVNAKRDIEPVETQTVLDKLSTLPVSTWEYKTDTQGVKHLGPMAQDFHRAFGLGDDPTRLAPGDVAGVALAAIQALAAEVAALKQANEAKDAELASLRSELMQTRVSLQRVNADVEEIRRRDKPGLVAARLN